MNTIVNFVSKFMQMRKIISILFTISLLSPLACNNQANKNNKPTVTVSIIPQQFFVNQIAGDWLNVNVMIPPGASPATYEPIPHQMKSLSKSKLYFQIGHIAFEKAWINKFTSVNADMKFVDTSAGLKLISDETDEGEEHKGHSHSNAGFNSHIWLSPNMVKAQVQIVFNELKITFPDYADEMKANLDTFITKCDSLQLQLDEILSTKSGVGFIVYHPVWSYLARDYNLKQIAIEQDGKEATPDKLKQIIDFAHTNNIHVVFAQKEFSNMQAQTIAKEIDGEVVQLNPLDYNWFKTMKKFGEVFRNL